QDERLLLIMEYASDGDLRTYLKSKNNTLTIEKKVKLAFDVTKGLYYLHKINIIHRDLHAKNIVIHEGKAKITDFGNSKFVDEQTRLHNGVFGVLPYIAPELLITSSNGSCSKASDIYSLGVLFWEIVSCKIPFEGYSHDKLLIVRIIDGCREECVGNNIPRKYSELYKSCWVGEPEKRPNIGDIREIMDDI
ncbi:kinase-like protein, partial [Rhizophagus irregularis]